ncbi:GNAT family N-acetyltransferase [Streptomyces sp. AK02-01A]|uniref:GNAT family N-acetyltransferase n=1 Tax=Streptomyces sp. AK02-01A TaxID=3028648 RepID=UPI0029A43076|nr:GNAT family N-acetyltransferase [Streptomyces sp. AK02-01A]MDX3853786.1 GNAT family N-acetyltransferase [Streptomyces sp. AK02-01A]
MIVEPLTPVDGALPGPLLTELAALYASNHEFQQLSGDFPDPDEIRPEQVAASLADELAHPDAEVLLARSTGRLVAIAVTLARHPDPDDPDAWIGLLMVHAREQRSGHGRALAGVIEERFRTAGRTGVRIAVPENNRKAVAFWTALGYTEIDRRQDRARDHLCLVLRKALG